MGAAEWIEKIYIYMSFQEELRENYTNVLDIMTNTRRYARHDNLGILIRFDRLIEETEWIYLP